ncbi:MAG: hypothetical protein L0027_17180 [Candidatus Rokubacteria bacterium]|nr:hypothetical protein [Candidatus Rokubacteria bacterium]
MGDAPIRIEARLDPGALAAFELEVQALVRRHGARVVSWRADAGGPGRRRRQRRA